MDVVILTLLQVGVVILSGCGHIAGGSGHGSPYSKGSPAVTPTYGSYRSTTTYGSPRATPTAATPTYGSHSRGMPIYGSHGMNPDLVTSKPLPTGSGKPGEYCGIYCLN